MKRKWIALLLIIAIIGTFSVTAFGKSQLTVISPKEKVICAISNEILVKGHAPVNSEVTILLNNNRIRTLKIGNTGIYAQVIKLKEGKNILTVKSGKEKITKELTFQRKKIAVEKTGTTASSEEGLFSKMIGKIMGIFN